MSEWEIGSDDAFRRRYKAPSFIGGLMTSPLHRAPHNNADDEILPHFLPLPSFPALRDCRPVQSKTQLARDARSPHPPARSPLFALETFHMGGIRVSSLSSSPLSPAPRYGLMSPHPSSLTAPFSSSESTSGFKGRPLRVAKFLVEFGSKAASLKVGLSGCIFKTNNFFCACFASLMERLAGVCTDSAH